MPAFLVMGNPGSGKSALARELARRGFLAIDPDYDPELSHREDEVGNRVEGPRSTDGEWLRSHRWVWRRSRMEEVLAGHDRAVFVCASHATRTNSWISAGAAVAVAGERLQSCPAPDGVFCVRAVTTDRYIL